MGNFDKGGRGGFGGGRPGGNGGRPAFNKGGRGGFGGGRDDRGPAVMHKVNCSDCGGVAEVPFRPTGEKPVYCNDCFGGKKDISSKSFDNRFDSRTDKRPTANTAVYSSTPRSESKADPRIGELKSQVEVLNSKLDRIVEMLRKEVPGPTLSVKASAPAAKSVAPVVPTKKTVTKASAPVKKVVAKKTVAIKKAVAKKVTAKKTTKKK